MTRFIAMLAALILLAATPLSAQDEGIVAGLSQNQVSITANFVGSEILIFGAVKRETPAPTDSDMNVVVVIEGPSHPITVRRKAKRMGIWVNNAAVEVDAAPSFYAVATSAPFDQAISETEDLRHHISIPQSIRLVGESGASADVDLFAEALVRIHTDDGLYKLQENTVEITENTLFSTRITLPSNLTEGDYHARVYLTRDGSVVSSHDAVIDVRKVGLERWLYNLAHDRPMVYGLMSLAIAIAAGWGASAAFRMLLRN